MDHNPLTAELSSTTSSLNRLKKRHAKYTADLTWHRSFDRPTAAQEAETLRTTHAALRTEVADVGRELTSGRKRGKELRRSSRLGLNIGYWFSLERHVAKEEGAKLYLRLVELESRERTLTGQVTQARKALTTADRKLDKYDKFDAEASESGIAALESEILMRQLELDRLSGRERALDLQLKEPLKILSDLKEDERRAEEDREYLLEEVSTLDVDIERANRYDRALDTAGNSYERALVHERCERTLGSGKPRAVISDRRRRLSRLKGDIDAKDRKLSSIRRSIAKTEARIAQTVERGTRDIRALVIDGSNLCYQHGAFIGLPALRTACDILSRILDVTVVFDASIQDKLGSATHQDLRTALPSATVHTVASRTKADETILSAAEDPFVFILSNDRFAEYQDKPAVRDSRLIRHEIINGRLLVHDLDVNAPFAVGG